MLMISNVEQIFERRGAWQVTAGAQSTLFMIDAMLCRMSARAGIHEDARAQMMLQGEKAGKAERGSAEQRGAR